jgi:hypothetical protein
MTPLSTCHHILPLEIPILRFSQKLLLVQKKVVRNIRYESPRISDEAPDPYLGGSLIESRPEHRLQ